MDENTTISFKKAEPITIKTDTIDEACVFYESNPDNQDEILSVIKKYDLEKYPIMVSHDGGYAHTLDAHTLDFDIYHQGKVHLSIMRNAFKNLGFSDKDFEVYDQSNLMNIEHNERIRLDGLWKTAYNSEYDKFGKFYHVKIYELKDGTKLERI